jgi:hypothetical protein
VIEKKCPRNNVQTRGGNKNRFFSIRQQQKIIIKEDRVEFARTENTHTKSTFNISREDPRMPAWAVVQRVL